MVSDILRAGVASGFWLGTNFLWESGINEKDPRGVKYSVKIIGASSCGQGPVATVGFHGLLNMFTIFCLTLSNVWW
jgi:hypothetical protein